MIYIIVFLSTILFSIGIVKIGAICLRITGMSWDNASFQALSAFTNCGYTTSLSENALNNPKRRKIISILIILGNAGVITVLVSLFQTSQIEINSKFFNEFVNFLPIIIALLIVYFFIFWKKYAIRKLDYIIENHLQKHGFGKFKSIEKLIKIKTNISFARIQILKTNQICGKSIKDLLLDSKNITILAIERAEKFISAPKETEVIEVNDILICCGNMHNVKKYIAFDN